MADACFAHDLFWPNSPDIFDRHFEGETMAIGSGRTLAAIAALIVLLPISSDAGTTIRAKFSFDGFATCQRPPVTNFPIHVEGTGALSTDRTATLNLNSSVGGQESYSAKLGGRPSEAPGGSAALRVISRHTLQGVRDYPNNQIIVYMTVVGNSCSVRVEHRLKPGKRQYTFYGNIGVAYCSKPQVTHAECASY
jgi:hypothetical protein